MSPYARHPACGLRLHLVAPGGEVIFTHPAYFLSMEVRKSGLPAGKWSHHPMVRRPRRWQRRRRARSYVVRGDGFSKQASDCTKACRCKVCAKHVNKSCIVITIFSSPGSYSHTRARIDTRLLSRSAAATAPHCIKRHGAESACTNGSQWQILSCPMTKFPPSDRPRKPSLTGQ